MIGIINYGLGNIGSVANAVSFCTDQGCRLVSQDLAQCSRLILPGVGAFGTAMENLRRLGLDQGIREAVAREIPLLGICLGMQLLATVSREFGLTQGLDLLPGTIQPLGETAQGLRIPHMGWNNVTARDPLFREIPNGSDFYFAHSYCFVPDDPSQVIGTTVYSGQFASAVRKGMVWGVQFHPEKSQESGLRLIRNFIEMERPC